MALPAFMSCTKTGGMSVFEHFTQIINLISGTSPRIKWGILSNSYAVNHVVIGVHYVPDRRSCIVECLG